MEPITILAVLGTLGYAAYKMLTQQKIEKEGEKDQTLSDLDNILGMGFELVGDIFQGVMNAYDWLQNDLVEFFGGEGYSTLKKHSKAFQAILNVRAKHDVINGQVLKELHRRIFATKVSSFDAFGLPIVQYENKNGLDVLWRGMVTIFNQAGYSHLFTTEHITTMSNVRSSNKLPYVPTGDNSDFADAIEAVVKRNAYGRTGKQYYNIKDFKIQTFMWEPNETNLNSSRKGKIHDYYPADANAVDGFNSLWVKKEGQTSWKLLHSLVPRHTYLYVISLYLKDGKAVNSAEYRFMDLDLDSKVKVFLAALFGDRNTIFKGFHYAKEHKGTFWKED